MNSGFDRLLKNARLAMPAHALLDLVLADRSMRFTWPDSERVEGKVSGSKRATDADTRVTRLPRFDHPNSRGQVSKKFASKLRDMRSKVHRAKPSTSSEPAPTDFDRRQRAVMKIHYFNHAGGSGGGLRAHGKYIARHAAGREEELQGDEPAQALSSREDRDQATYLTKSGRGAFYDAESQAEDAATRLDNWAKADRRHFRLILSAEEGERLRDLQAYARQVMSRAEAALGTRLSWVAVDHHDTDNPHTHIIVRGRRDNGQDLIIPKDFIKHGFRNIARDVATDTLGSRTPEQEREALDRDARRLGPSRLDWRIAQSASGRWEIAIDALHAKDNDPAVTKALRMRVQELERMGLAKETERGLFQLDSDWQDRLKAMELHLDIRKRLVREQAERSMTRLQYRDRSRGHDLGR